jgi:hypothetical protein
MNFDRLKIVERQVINIDVLKSKIGELARGSVPNVYFKIDEGPDLNRVEVDGQSLLDYLDTFCKDHDIDKNCIMIESDNLAQVDVWPNYIKHFNSRPFLYVNEIEHRIKKDIQKKFGMFIGGARWPRLLLMSSLYNRHNKDALFTFNHSNFNLEHYLDAIPEQYHGDIYEFYNSLPLTLSEQPYRNGYINFDKACDELLPYYNKIFMDVVCETWHEGQCFLPTEKIARPIKSQTPFVVYGPKHYLQNLRRLGFETFDKFWSEDYDQHEGTDRIKMIIEIINDICGRDLDQLKTLYTDMTDVCDHNASVLAGLDGDKILRTFL